MNIKTIYDLFPASQKWIENQINKSNIYIHNETDYGFLINTLSNFEKAKAQKLFRNNLNNIPYNPDYEDFKDIFHLQEELYKRCVTNHMENNKLQINQELPGIINQIRMNLDL